MCPNLSIRWMALWFAGFSLVALGACRRSRPSGSQPPTTGQPARQAADEDLEEDEEELEETPRQGTRPLARPRSRARAAPTINGHPKGPRAEVFNRVVQSAFPRVQACFVARLAAIQAKAPSIQVHIEVGNSGRVVQARVVGGVTDPQLRRCVLDVFRSLRFPRFEGPAVSQTIPFTLVRQTGAGQGPGAAKRQ